MKVSTIQMQISDGNPSKNRKNLSNLLDEHPDSDLYLAPELWTSGYVQSQWSELAEKDTPRTLDWMANEARKRCVWIGGSLIAKKSDGAIVNKFVLFNRLGELVSEYIKAHLFHPLQEHIYLDSGKYLPNIIKIDGWLVAPAICYDLRFPEMFRRLALRGVDMFLVSSEWPYPRQHALRILAEARAIENQAIVVLSNRIGEDKKGTYFCGGSGIFGPHGVVAEAKESQMLLTTDIKLQDLHDIRSSFPVMSHRISGIDYE